MAQRLTALTSLALILILGWAGWTRVSAPSDGTVVQLSNAVWHQDRIPVSYPLCPCGGVEAGDVVVAIAGPAGDVYTYTVLRDGVRQEVPVRLGSLSWMALLRATWAALLTAIVMFAVGWFVFAHRRDDPAARTLLLAASLFGFGTTTWLIGQTALRMTTHGPGLIDFLGELALALVWGAVAHFAVIAPGTTLRFPAKAIALLYAAPLLLHAGYLAVVLPSSSGRLETAGRLAQVSLLPILIMPLVVAVLMVLSYRRTPGPEARQRLRWVLISFLAAAAAVSLWTVPMLWHRTLLSTALLPTAMLPPVLALAVAVLRYRLFDIEVIVRRSLLYGALTATVLAAYLSVGSLVGHLMGAGPGLAAVLATCLVAFGIQPVRIWLQSRIGHVIYGDRDNPFGVVSRLSRVDAAAAPQTALYEVSGALARALRLTYVGIELRTAEGPVVAAHYGEYNGLPHVIPLRHGSATVGRLLLGVGPRQEPFGPADRRLLEALTRQLGGVAAIVLLNAELRQARHRLVLAREEERRRTAHALHDGLETVLTAQIGQVAGIRALVASDPDRAGAELGAAVAGTRGVIRDVRAMVVGLRPPSLDQLGLLGAIRERVSRRHDEAGGHGPLLEVVAENDLGELPAAVEVAAFWIVVEAADHAENGGAAPYPRAVLTRRGDLLVEVRNGGGFRPGAGLAGAADRATELGGTMTSTATALQARLPIRERT